MSPHGQKRRRVGGDVDQPTRSQRSRTYTDAERLILQQAALILNVTVRDLPFGQDIAQLASNIEASDTNYVRPNGPDPLPIPIAVDGARPGPGLDAIQTRPTSIWITNGELHGRDESQPQSTPSGSQPNWNIEPIESGPMFLRIGDDGLIGQGESRTNYTTNGYQPTQSVASIESVPPLLEANCCVTNEGNPSLPLGAFPPTSNTDPLFTYPIALQSTYSGAATLDEIYPTETLTNSLPSSNIESIPAPLESDYGATHVLSESDPSLAHLGNIVTHQSLRQVIAYPEISHGQHYEPDIQSQFDDFNSVYNPAYDVPQCLTNPEWQYSLPTSLSSIPLPQAAVAPWLPSQSPTQQLQFDHSVAQNFNPESAIDQSYYCDSLATSNFWDSLPQWRSDEMAFLDLPPSQINNSINERQLALRGPSPNAVSAMANNTTRNERQEHFRETQSAGQNNPSLQYPISSSLLEGPTVNKVIIFTGCTTGQPNETQGPRVRRPFQDLGKRKETGETRKIGACVRCHMQKIRCSPVKDNNDGPCETCAKVSGPTLCKLPCVRYKITDSSLFDKGQHPQFRWSGRWPSWDLVEIDTWASDEIKTITITQDVFGGSTFKIRCRKFIPMECDALARSWKKNGATVYYQRAPYAVLSMKKTGNEIKRFVANNIGASIKYYIIEKKDRLLASTYAMAYAMVFRPRDFVQNEEGRRLLQEVFQLWVAIRMESQSERIIGEETLGMEPQTFDPDVASYGTNSIPPIMSAQIELMTTTQILQPLKKAVLKRLQRLIQANDLNHWFSIYLCLFILLHSCSILTTDENRQARKYGLETRYVYDAFIEELHMGAKTMIYYFHYCNKGSHPFTPDWISEENLALAELNVEQTQFLKESSALINERLPEFEKIRESQDFENDYYFVSQLYDGNWRPTFTI